MRRSSSKRIIRQKQFKLHDFINKRDLMLYEYQTVDGRTCKR